jgi:hypothetical protein
MSLDSFDRVPLLFGPSPVHRLERLSEHLGGEVEIWAKSEDPFTRRYVSNQTSEAVGDLSAVTAPKVAGRLSAAFHLL